MGQDRLALLGLIGLMLILAVSLLAPWLAPADPVAIDYDAILQPPSPSHPFGTDDLGRDVLSRVLWGGRQSLRTAVMASFAGLTGGLLLGLVSGFRGGALDSALQRVLEVFLAFPFILFLLSIVAILGPGDGTILIAASVAMIPPYTRLVRGSVLSVRNLDYIMASRALGASDTRIIFRHVLPNVLPTVMVYATLGLGGIILAAAGLSYLGLGVQPPTPEWGAMLNAGRTYIRSAWWMSVFPGLAIFLTVLCVNLLGDGLRDALDPRQRSL